MTSDRRFRCMARPFSTVENQITGGLFYMSRHTVVTVIEGSLTSVFVQLEGFDIGLSYDGQKTYMSTDLLDIDGALNVTFHGIGISFAKWTITITLDGAEKPLFKQSGTVPFYNESILKVAIPLSGSDSADFQLQEEEG